MVGVADVVAAEHTEAAFAADVSAQGERSGDERPEDRGVEERVDGEAGPEWPQGKIRSSIGPYRESRRTNGPYRIAVKRFIPAGCLWRPPIEPFAIQGAHRESRRKRTRIFNPLETPIDSLRGGEKAQAVVSKARNESGLVRDSHSFHCVITPPGQLRVVRRSLRDLPGMVQPEEAPPCHSDVEHRPEEQEQREREQAAFHDRTIAPRPPVRLSATGPREWR